MFALSCLLRPYLSVVLAEAVGFLIAMLLLALPLVFQLFVELLD